MSKFISFLVIPALAVYSFGQQVSDAARALGSSAQPSSKDAAINTAMDDLSRLRDQLANLGGKPNGQPDQGQGQPGRAGQPGGQQFQTGALSRGGRRC